MNLVHSKDFPKADSIVKVNSLEVRHRSQVAVKVDFKGNEHEYTLEPEQVRDNLLAHRRTPLQCAQCPPLSDMMCVSVKPEAPPMDEEQLKAYALQALNLGLKACKGSAPVTPVQK